MTKLVPLTCLCLLLLCTILSAQSPAGSISISSGIGLLPSYTGKTVENEKIPMTFEIGYRATNVFSIGAYAGFTEASSAPKVQSDGGSSTINNKTKLFGLKAQMHKSFTDQFEMYGGALLGYASFKTKETDSKTGEEVIRISGEPTPFDPNAPKGQIVYTGFLGGKFWLSKNIGVFSEIGFGVSLLTAGFSFQFK